MSRCRQILVVSGLLFFNLYYYIIGYTRGHLEEHIKTYRSGLLPSYKFLSILRSPPIRDVNIILLFPFMLKYTCSSIDSLKNVILPPFPPDYQVTLKIDDV